MQGWEANGTAIPQEGLGVPRHGQWTRIAHPCEWLAHTEIPALHGAEEAPGSGSGLVHKCAISATLPSGHPWRTRLLGAPR